uniref:Uncharacterized protein n=1 Tax=Rhipicephalus zambeziensis TaxID=60191 RepID=A0A224Y5V7_9ACAR
MVSGIDFTFFTCFLAVFVTCINARAVRLTPLAGISAIFKFCLRYSLATLSCSTQAVALQDMKRRLGTPNGRCKSCNGGVQGKQLSYCHSSGVPPMLKGVQLYTVHLKHVIPNTEQRNKCKGSRISGQRHTVALQSIHLRARKVIISNSSCPRVRFIAGIFRNYHESQKRITRSPSWFIQIASYSSHFFQLLLLQHSANHHRLSLCSVKHILHRDNPSSLN